MVINLMAGMPPSDFNYAERKAWVAGATEQAIKDKEEIAKLVEALERIKKEKHYLSSSVMADIAEQALLNYKP
jgi:NADH:ubiquinone oxidoreductase subunit E